MFSKIYNMVQQYCIIQHNIKFIIHSQLTVTWFIKKKKGVQVNTILLYSSALIIEWITAIYICYTFKLNYTPFYTIK